MLFRRPAAYIPLCVLAVLLNVVAWVAVLFPSTPTLEVSFLDVGQGDAIFIEGPSGMQMLIDGGLDRSVLRELGKRMGLLDRSIDVVVETHPDADHIGGLPGVLAAYRVGAFIEPGIINDTTPTRALEDAVAREPILHPVIARQGMRIQLGGGAYADILFPDRAVEEAETNTGSIIMRVAYGDTSFMLTGDAPSSIEEWLVRLYGSALGSDVLKAGHHGSRTSSSAPFLAAVNPEVVVISAGKDNQYGHPHADVVSRIEESGAAMLSTATEGTVRFVSDGRVIRQK